MDSGISYKCNVNGGESIMAGTSAGNEDKRGLKSASKATRTRVAKMGGAAFHEKRGAKGTDSRKTIE
jgi:hypothetical protein